MKVYFDTNVLVAGLKVNHVHHAASFAAIERARQGHIDGVISGQSLAELYSVLTRTPFVPPVYPNEAEAMIEQSIVPHFKLVDVSAASYRAAIAACAKAGWRGGRVHDIVHVQAAAQAGCDRIYTYDLEHMRALAPEWGDRIQRPGTTA